MTINYNFDIEDWMAFQKYHLFESHEYKKLETLGRYFFIIIVCAYLLYEVYNNSEILYLLYLLIFFSITSIVWYIYFPRYYKNHIIKKLRKTLQQGKNKSILGKQELVLNKEKIVLKTPGIIQEMNIKTLEKIINTPEYIFIYNTSVSAIVIPKNQITHIEENYIMSLQTKK